MHGLKYQCVVLPNGMVAKMYGLVGNWFNLISFFFLFLFREVQICNWFNLISCFFFFLFFFGGGRGVRFDNCIPWPQLTKILMFDLYSRVEGMIQVSWLILVYFVIWSQWPCMVTPLIPCVSGPVQRCWNNTTNGVVQQSHQRRSYICRMAFRRYR